MRRLGLTISVLLVLVPGGLAAAVPQGYHATAGRELHPGVDFFTMGRDHSQELAYVARLAPGAKVAMRGVSSNDEVAHHSSALELPSSMCARTDCIVGINADFYSDTHEAVGGVVAGRRMLRSPSRGHPQVSITRKGSLVAGEMPWSASLGASKGGTLAIDGINVSPGPDQLVLYTPAWGDRTGTSSGVELVLRVNGPVGVLGQTTTVQLLNLEGPGSAIPADGAVVSGSGSGATRLRSLWDKVRADRGVLRVDSPVDALESVGGNPVLLHKGKPVFPEANDGFTTWRNPRTLVGWNDTGVVFLVAVDGRRDDANGMTMAEAADFLLGLGATEGINLDGGGGTTFVVEGSVVNRPSDGSSPTDSVERPAVNALVVVAAPSSPGPGTADGSPSAPPASPNPSDPAPGGPPGPPLILGADPPPAADGEVTDWTQATDPLLAEPGTTAPAGPGTAMAAPASTRSRAAASGIGGTGPVVDDVELAAEAGHSEQAALARADRAVAPGRSGGVPPVVALAGAAVALLGGVTTHLGFMAYRRRQRRLRHSWLG